MALATSEVSGKSTDELRKMLRQHYPGLRGDFAAVVSADICKCILTEQHKAEEFVVHVDANGSKRVMLKTAAGLGPVAQSAVDPNAGNVVSPQLSEQAKAAAVVETLNAAALEETLSGAVDTDKQLKELATALQGTNEVAKQISVMRPDMAKSITKLEQTSMTLMEKLLKSEEAVKNWRVKAETINVITKPDASTQLVAVGGEVTVAGVKVKQLYNQGDPEMQWVPGVDQHFRFDYWRGCTKTAVGEVEFTAGDVIGALLSGCNLHLFGDPGVGKTTLIEQFCAATNWPFFRVQGDKFFQPGDLVGEKTVSAGNISFQYGPLPLAMQVGGIFVADEIDYFPASCKTVFNPILEPTGALVLGANGGEIIRKHPNFRFVCTSNTQLFGDPTGKYPDTQLMNAALISRIGVSIHAEYMSKKHEMAVLVARTGIAPDDAKQMVELANSSREGVENQNLLYALSLRHLVEWGKMSHQVGLTKAFACTCLTKVPPSDATVLMELAQRHLGEKLKGL